MAEVKVNVDFEQLVRRLKALPVELGSNKGGPLRVALRASGRVIQAQAKANAASLPTATGRLSRAIRLSLFKDPAKMGGTEAFQLWVYPGRKRTDQRGAYYWKMVEFGTEKMHARPFLRPAFESKKHAALGEFKVRFGKAIEAAERKLSRMR